MSSLSFLKFQHNVLSRSSPKQSRISTTKDHQIRQKPNVTSKLFHPKVEELRSFFNKFDANKDGKISEEEYKLALRVTGGKNNIIATESEMGKALKVADSDGDGYIDFEEFTKVHRAKGAGVKGFKEPFEYLILDGNGKISAEELSEVMRRLGEKSRMLMGMDSLTWTSS